MTISKKQALNCLQVNGSNNSTQLSDRGTIMERKLKRLRAEDHKAFSLYIDICFLPPTFNICEKLYSIAGYALSNRWKGILPANSESRLFLFMNKSL